jgi:hypothetical protein
MSWWDFLTLLFGPSRRSANRRNGLPVRKPWRWLRTHHDVLLQPDGFGVGMSVFALIGALMLFFASVGATRRATLARREE